MIPLTLRIAGFLSYLEPVELDFSGFDMACISGANGAGKSSLLDAITWALFGKARAKDDVILHNSPNNKAAEVTFTFRYESNIYRIQRTKPRDKSTLLEFHVQTAQGLWRPLTESSVRVTEERIRQRLSLDYETFINASFFLQGKADQFAQQRPADRKRILSNILGLEIWDVYKERTAERRRLQESEQIGLDRSLAEKNAELAEEAERRARLKQLEQELSQSRELRLARQSSLDTLRRLQALLDERKKAINIQQAQLNAAQQRLNQRQKDAADRIQERTGYQAQLAAEGEIKATYQGWQIARQDLERWDGVFARFTEQQAQRNSVLAAIENQRSLLEHEQVTLSNHQKEELTREAHLPALEAELRTINGVIQELTVQLARLPDLDNDQTVTRARMVETRANNDRLRLDMAEIKERIDQLSEVESPACPLCGQPLSPIDREKLLISLNQQGKEMGDTYRANQDGIQQMEKQVESLRAEMARLRGLEQGELRQHHARISSLTERLAQVQAQVDAWKNGEALRLAEVSQKLTLKDYAHEARAQLEQMDVALRELGYDPTGHAALRQAEREGRASEERLRQLESARGALLPLEREIEGLEKQIGEDEWQIAAQQVEYQKAQSQYAAEAAQLPDLNALEDEVRDLQERENTSRDQVGGAKQKVAVLTQVREQQKKLTSQREETARLIARLKMLERAFSKDGVPALLIEEALPEIQEQANEILEHLSAGGMAVRFNTLKEYKDKNRSDQRETLDIFISDATGEREYELFSGGEAFRINFAIRLALSRVLAQRAGARLQTLVIDEGFGSQDADGRHRLLEALNLVRDDFAKVLVITHLEDLKDAFPARIEVEKTLQGSRVSVVI